MQRLLHIFLFVLALIGTQDLIGQTLIHYWSFNNSATETDLLTPSAGAVSGGSIVHVPGPASLIQVTSNTNQGFEVSNLNARNGDPSGTHLRFNDPIGGALVFSLPTTGYQQVVVRYATRRSGSGAGTQTIDYTLDGMTYSFFTAVDPVDGDPTLQTLDFSAVAGVSDNPDFGIRITFAQGPGGTGGNNRFDNFTVDGFPAGADIFPPSVAFDPADNAIDVPPTVTPRISFSEDIRLVNDQPVQDPDVNAIIAWRADSLNGSEIDFAGFAESREITLTALTALDNDRLYYIILKGGTVEDTSDNAIAADIVSSFLTIREQTVFTPGDLVPVAYRMNADGAEDEVALLALANILPGTKVQMTDAKYTDNAQPQCAGGITWTSPDNILPAGTVVVIGNDAGTASHGTVSGSTFGLSSNGDQFIVYTGTADQPAHITALSSNAWVTGDHTACGGSLSKLPEGLADGMSSINLSTASGNTAGNTVNAYYNGPQQGTNDELRTLILDPANWIGAPAGTPAQEWPAYNFPGPPAVVQASVINQNTIQVAYSKDMNPASTTLSTNYTGIDDIQVILQTDNGDLPDTVNILYQQPFVNGQTYTLNIAGVEDAEGRILPGTFTYTFTYATSLAFDGRYLSVSEDEGLVTIPLTFAFPSPSSVTVHYVPAPYSTASTADILFAPTTLTFTGNEGPGVGLSFSIQDDLLPEQDEYLIIELRDAEGLVLLQPAFFTLYIRDNDRVAPDATRSISLDFISRYTVDNPDEATGLAEIVAFDEETQRLYAISTGLAQFDIIDFRDPADPRPVSTVSIAPYGSGITSVAASNGIVAVTVTGLDNEQQDGSVVVFDTDGKYLNKVTAGALPDMVTFTPDGRYVLTANEGQPNDDYSVDPEGSVSIIDLSGGIASLSQANVTTAGFSAFNTQEGDLLAAGMRKLKSTSTLAQDIEPEYITVSEDSRSAWVTLQENNAVARLDLTTGTITEILPLGTKDYSTFGAGLDLSDRNTDIHIANWPLRGFYIPDAIDNFVVNGTRYLVTANEGDEKEYAGLNERTTVSAVQLDPTAFPYGAMLKENHNMGRFRITNLHGDTDGDGDYDELYCVGGRSVTIWNAETGERIADTGDEFERITAASPLTAPIFNSDHEENGLKGRSRSKGPEPEGLTVAPFNDELYAFITLERIGGVMVYDISDPANPVFTDYINTRTLDELGGDLGPEGVIYISHPNGSHYVLVANEISGTVSIFEIDNVIVSNDDPQATTGSVLYPNPVAAGAIVSLDAPQDITVISMDGRIMHAAHQVRQFSTSGWAPGMYIVRNADGDLTRLVVTN